MPFPCQDSPNPVSEQGMNSLGVKHSDDIKCKPACKDEPFKPDYPHVEFNSTQAKLFLDGQSLKPGTVYEVPIQFRVKSWDAESDYRALCVCVLSSGDIEEVDGEEDEPSEDKPKKNPVAMAVDYVDKD